MGLFGGVRKMTNRTWLGGGLNLATNPNDWSPSGVPQPGDVPTMNGGTMNIIGGDLAGDTLILLGTESAVHTINLLFASLTAEVPYPSYFNPNPPSDIDVITTFNMVVSSLSFTQASYASTTFNLYGVDTFQDTVSGNQTIDLTANSTWKGSITSLGEHEPGYPAGVGGAVVSINGATKSVFDNDAASSIGGNVKIDTNVVGVGSFALTDVNSTLEFIKSVGANQTVIVGGGPFDILQLDDPQQFYGAAEISSSTSVIDLNNLANADSYTYRNDMLAIYNSHGQIIDTLRLTFANGLSIDVEKNSTGVAVYGAMSGSMAPGISLPLHA
jgi:hypothetical protein